jgi:hypothetical protein
MEFTGQFVAVERVEVRARVTGYLIHVHFEDGQLVEADDQLYTTTRGRSGLRSTLRSRGRPKLRRRSTSPICSAPARSA